ncbi:MAG: pilus (MSHA type) biogenesis protein MshL [Epsilonproteobacteria bacterium]|nr:pilus (MSHA type) biogenesis protein MshL [Campylobacterota bacterium]
MQKLRLSLIKQLTLLSIIIFLSISSLYGANSCRYRVFNIQVSDEVTTQDLLNQLSQECDFSIVTKDSVAQKELQKKIFGINVKNMTLEEIFNLLLLDKGMEYDFKNGVLKIYAIFTKSFKVDYVSTKRIGKSNTDITLTGDSSSASGDSKTGNANSAKSSSGMSITSDETFDFWDKLDKELGSILNTPQDEFKAPPPIINKEGGIITVTGTKKQIYRISKYIDDLMDRLHKQVMIDVKILSVSLNDSKSIGIDWGQLYKLQNFKASFEVLNTNNLSQIEGDDIKEFGDILPSAHATFFKLTGGSSLNELIKFLKTQGDVTSISNPKVVTLNNQPALFSSGEQLYYKRLESTTTSSTSTTTAQNEIIESIFAGILLDITPEITDNDEIILKINPSISSIKDAQVETKNSVRTIPPDLLKKQISSVVKLKDGERIILGGLIDTKYGKDVSKVPLLGSIPVIGNLFKKEQKIKTRSELVIIITPHIIKNGYKKKTVSLKDLGYTRIKNE